MSFFFSRKLELHLTFVYVIVFYFIFKDDITGDGTTSNVLIIGELLKQVSEVYKSSVKFVWVFNLYKVDNDVL